MSEPTPAEARDHVSTLVNGIRERDAEIKRLRALVAGYENGITWHTACLNCAKLLDSSYAETMRAEKAEATIARVRAVLDQKDSDIDRAERTSSLPILRRIRISEIRAALGPPDLPAVREFVAKHDPRPVQKPPTITEILDHAAELDRLRRDGELK